MNKVGWIIFGAIVVLILGGLVVYSRISNPGIDVSNVDPGVAQVATDNNGQIADHTYGNEDSKVVLIEYGDFQCPSCGGAHPNIKSILEDYKDDILFIFRNFPITNIHPNAKAAAAAAEAAGLQGKYWEMHDMVFENQNSWKDYSTSERTDAFKAYAEQLGLDVDRFGADLSLASINRKIAFDVALAKKVGVDATPTFILNGEKISQEASSDVVGGSGDKLRELLDNLLN